MHALMIFISLSSSPHMAAVQLFHHVSVLFLVTLLSSTHLSSFSAVEGTVINGGFSFELIRRDSPKSPFAAASTTSTAGTSVLPESSQFLMRLSVGTPARDIFAILDTGSDLFWTQCLPCATCYKQIAPVFDPSKSSTFRELSCRSEQCRLVDTGTCSGAGTCSYSYGYGGGLTQGILATETVSLSSKFGGSVSFENVVFGCGHNNSGAFNPNEMGLIGLGRAPLSFLSQVAPSIGGRKFSYCLMPFNTDPQISSTITLGSGSEVHGAGVITVPLVSTPDPTIYSFTLTGISVGPTFLPFNSSGPAANGNVFLDSGTPPSLLPQDLYDRLTAEVKRQIPSAPSGGGGFCYAAADGFTAPPMSFRFDGGVELPLTTVQTFIRMSDGKFCFAMQGFPGSNGIIGNFQQANFLVGFDVDANTVSFKPTDCTKFG